MGNIIRLVFCGIMSLWSLCGLDAYNDVENLVYTNHRNPDENYVNDAVNGMISHPYSSPDYLLQQVYIVKGFSEQFCGMNFDLVNILKVIDREVQLIDKKRKISDKHLTSLINFIQKRNGSYHQGKIFGYSINLMCLEGDDFCQGDLNVINKGIFDLPFKYYELDEIVYDVKHCKDIAQTVIDEVPPRLTFGVFLSIVGELLCNTPWGRAAKIAKEAGKVLILESAVVSCEKQNEKLKTREEEDLDKHRKMHEQVPFWIK